MKNKRAQYVGEKHLAREHIYTPDGAKALVTLAMNHHAYGQHWNIPATATITGEELIAIIRNLTNYDKKITPVTKNMLRFVGLFDRQMREFVELQYLYEDPVVLSGEKYEREIGPLPKTSYIDGMKQTIESLKEM